MQNVGMVGNTGPQSGINERQSKIVEIARSDGFVYIEELAKIFDVTSQTIRRDIKILCDQGILRRYHGGASLASNTANMDYSQRREVMKDEKLRIGEMIAQHIPDGASLFLNVGTTTESVASALLNHKALRIITNNINVAAQLSQREDFDVTIAPGRVRPPDLAVIGEATIDFIHQFKVDFGIIGISGIDEDGMMLDFDYREVRVAQSIIKNSRTIFLATDSTKFGRRAMVKLGHLSELDGLFLDAMPPEPYASLLVNSGVNVHVASASSAHGG